MLTQGIHALSAAFLSHSTLVGRASGMGERHMTACWLNMEHGRAPIHNRLDLIFVFCPASQNAVHRSIFALLVDLTSRLCAPTSINYWEILVNNNFSSHKSPYLSFLIPPIICAITLWAHIRIVWIRVVITSRRRPKTYTSPYTKRRFLRFQKEDHSLISIPKEYWNPSNK